MKLKNLKYIAASTAIFLVFLIIAGELITRIFGATIVYEYNKTLGWRPKENFSAKIRVIDKSGEKYFVNYSANEYGFREFGNLNNNRKRILFVGDSWTGDPNTSDEDAYFGIVKNNLPVEVFAIGAGGYGTLQELMLIKEYAVKIKPDIFVLQYCDNDLINNSYFLEGPSITRNQKNLRPYWVNNQITYRLSANSVYVVLYKNSRLFRTVDSVLSGIQYKIYNGYYPPPYEAYDIYDTYGRVGKGSPSPELKAEIVAQRAKAIAVTQFLMSEMKRVLPAGTKLITFSASTDNTEALQSWLTLSENAGFAAYPSVSMKVEEAEKNGAIVRVRDGAHWNRLGNKIAGEELARIIQRDFLQ
jgi:hypothetical protein